MVVETLGGIPTVEGCGIDYGILCRSYLLYSSVG